jgi:hypothetical protein
MAVQPLAREHWHAYLEELTKLLEGRAAAVEVASADFGDQQLAQNVPLLGLTYDRHGDVIDVALEGIDHRVPHPKSLAFDTLPGGVIAIELVGEDDVRTLLTLTEPLLLPEPADRAPA